MRFITFRVSRKFITGERHLFYIEQFHLCFTIKFSFIMYSISQNILKPFFSTETQFSYLGFCAHFCAFLFSSLF